jgi:hypothetical protein
MNAALGAADPLDRVSRLEHVTCTDAHGLVRLVLDPSSERT